MLRAPRSCASNEDLAPTVRRQANDDDLIDRRDEHFTNERGAILFVCRRVDSRIEVELMAVSSNRALAPERQNDVAQRLVFLLLDRISHQPAAEQPVRLDQIASEDETSDVGKRRGATRYSRRIGTARPVRVFVDLDSFFVRPPKHHRAESAVADGQGVLPLLRRVAEPDRVVGSMESGAEDLVPHATREASLPMAPPPRGPATACQCVRSSRWQIRSRLHPFGPQLVHVVPCGAPQSARDDGRERSRSRSDSSRVRAPASSSESLNSEIGRSDHAGSAVVVTAIRRHPLTSRRTRTC